MPLDDLNLADLDRFAAGFPHEMFTLLRPAAPRAAPGAPPLVSRRARPSRGYLA